MKKRDWLIVGAVAVIAVVGSVIAFLLRSPSGTVNIYKDGVLYCTRSVGSVEEIEIRGDDGCVNVVEISREGVRMKSSTCPNKTCVDQGWLTPENSGYALTTNWIVCLPNRVSVEVVWNG